MTGQKALPPRPSLDSLRKQAKTLARDIAAGDPDAIGRAHAQLPQVDLPLSLRNAQLVLAREYGYAGWQDLTAAVSTRLGRGLEWAATQAQRAIHDNDVERLKHLLADYPALLSWKRDADHAGLLGSAAGSFGDSFDPFREEHFTRAACAELLIDAGAVVAPSVCEHLVDARAMGLLRMFQRKGLLPRTLRFLVALGDIDAVRAALDESRHDRATVNDAFMCACLFEREDVASPLLERAITLDPDLARHIPASLDGLTFIRSLIADRSFSGRETASGPWQAYLMDRVMRAVHERDVTAFVSWLRREPWLLGDVHVPLHVQLVERAALHGTPEFIEALLDLEPALLRHQPRPPTQAFEHAFTYAHAEVVPLLTRIRPVPHDLAHAAGLGDLTGVQQWFDASGAPALGNLEDHFPFNGSPSPGNLRWGAPTVQHVLDTALAFAVVNRHFGVADFLLARGANINTDWSSHEPASILHELVFHANYESMRYLIERGIDMTIVDGRWNGTAQGWAFHAAKDENMAQWLEDAQRHRDQGHPLPSTPE